MEIWGVDSPKCLGKCVSFNLAVFVTLWHAPASYVFTSSALSRTQQNSGGKKNTSVDLDSEFANSRYVPPLKIILEELLQNRLSVEDYPAVRDLPESHGAGGGGASARKRVDGSARRGGATSRWQRSSGAGDGNAKDQSYQGGRVIVFSIGGMSYSELRVAREIMAKESKEVVTGSTFFTKPDDFVDDIRRLSKVAS